MLSEDISKNINKRVERKKNTEKPNILLSYSEYIKNQNSIHKYKVPELKSIAKNLRLLVSGSKSILIERIKTHFIKFSKCVTIQKIFRGFIVRRSFQLRGDAFKNRSICVNNTDFYTLEPLEDIDFELFYSYKDSQDFHYGFNISSLIKLMKNKNNILNPYNREIFPKNTILDIVSLYKKIFLLFPKILEPEDNLIEKPRNVSHQSNHVNSVISNTNDIQLIQEIQNNIQRVREKNIHVRMNELFMEIDQLGNYTNFEWFSMLELRDYVKLYRTLYDIWNYRAQLSNTMKRNICMIGNPFANIFLERIYYQDLSFSRIREACLIVFENLVYCGIDIEHRKIGTMHALSALTVVSHPARNSMPWLYESIIG